MITAEQIELLGKLIQMLRNTGVRNFRMRGLSFDLGPVYKTSGSLSFPLPADENEDERKAREKKELEELLYASAGN